MVKLIKLLLTKHYEFESWLDNYFWLSHLVKANRLYTAGILLYNFICLFFTQLLFVGWREFFIILVLLNVVLFGVRFFEIKK
ncbi:hypothetical protein FOF72_07210 [Lactobacillus jensenii]|uniref:Uncharacterized protein n=1 Tax=Lactobacillus jensenii TaxID=109790 RepID=A0A5N1I611_LACJE|nr:hypothetical protein [Lactobacillus jensenii]EEQ68407.1 hypothetical protein LBJG_00835 [Lactobacillus jensenii 1153]EEX27260.1 hypothetical protein HMPREF0527_00892 [Lactobacillus jensenii SJ-7A-US]APT14178.1 hypothetical protein BUE77_01615 [Lactobacillus jensenii]KAA9234882.1 hypothetical protein F6I36_07050 [Lactobacillus jensenii]KAA9259158.1 hypothetical protein F6I24_03190 [Lactobacillus jensenii]